MEWTDISITVAKRDADTAEAIATMVANGGIYIEDYSDLEQQAWEIAHVDLIDLLGLDMGAIQRLFDDDGAQLSGGDIGEGAAELANGSTAGAGDDDLFHK